MSKIMILFLQFLAYALASSSGLILIKRALPEAVSLVQAGRIVDTVTLNMVIGFMLYALSFAIWMIILSKSNLSVAYPIALGLSVVGTLIGATLILGETTSAAKLTGPALIIAGIALVTNG